MRIRRLAVPIAITSALVVLGGITAGLILAGDQAPPVAPPEVVVSVPGSAATLGPELAATPEPRLAAMLGPGLAATPGPELAVVLEPGLAATPGPKLAVVLEPGLAATPGPELAVVLEPGLAATPGPELAVMLEPDLKATPETQMGGSSEGASSEMEGASQGMVYTWQDGDRTLKAVLQAAPVAQETETAAGASEDYAVTKGEADGMVRKQSELGSGGQPVFRSESGGALMTLPGGVILALDPEWDQDVVEKFFSQNGISLERASELDFLDNGFFVETEPGFPSLELANALAGQEGVILSSPNWSREVELK